MEENNIEEITTFDWLGLGKFLAMLVIIITMISLAIIIYYHGSSINADPCAMCETTGKTCINFLK